MTVQQKQVISLRLEPKLIEALDHIADRDESTPSQLMRRYIREGVERDKKRNGK